MTGTRTASVTADCARCVSNAPVLVGVIYCEAKISLSNSLAVLGVFSLAYNRGKYGAFMHLFLSLFCPPELHCFLCLSNIYCTNCTATGPVLYGGLVTVQLHTSPCSVLYCYCIYRT
jgi:hypothetical protein